MKLLFSLGLCLSLSMTAFAQKKETSSSKEKAIIEHFKNDYKKKNYKKFEGKITVKDNFAQFDEKVINYNKSDKTTKLLLQEGIIYPQLLTDYQMEKFLDETTDKTQKRYLKLQKDPRASFDVNNMRINNSDELVSLSTDPKIKRFKLVCNDSKIPGTPIYIIKLINKGATKETSSEEFIKNSKLTYLKQL
ncbi:MAG: hypothetical protein WCJ72_13865 [Chryseobacterium sp.]